MPSSAPEERASRALDGLAEHERAHPAPLRGSRPSFERYDVGDVLGEGAGSVVYRGRDRQLGRDVALKVLREPVGRSAEIRERFLREARVGAGLDNAHVVDVYDIVESEGRLCLVQELVEGQALDVLLAAKSKDRTSLLRILEKAARGVAAAHAKGIVHRDLKPANILVAGTGEPKVGDLGLAHVAGSDGALTRTGAVMGTPLYMAPEQVRGRGAEVTPRTDVWALGAILYEILTGRAPHHGETVTEIYARILGDDATSPRRGDTTISRDLETIAMTALEKDPARRYATAAEFAEDLRRHLAGEAIVAHPPGALRRAQRWVRRHKAVVMPVAILFVAVVTSFITNSSREKNRRLALAQFDAGEAWMEEGREDRAEESWRAALRIDPTLASAHHRLGRMLMVRAYLEGQIAPWDSDEPSPAAKALAAEAASEIARAIDGRLEAGVVADTAAAMLAYAKGEGDATREILTRAVTAAKGKPGVEELYWLGGLVSSGEACLRCYDAAIAKRPTFALAYYSRANERLARREFALALGDYDMALKLKPNFPRALLNRGAAKAALGDRKGEMADYDEVIRLEPKNPRGYAVRGHTWKACGDPGRAEADLREALKVAPAEWAGRPWVQQRLNELVH